jgi:flotillin
MCRYQWPFQRVTKITLAPRNFSFTLHCISKDLVPFDLPVVFTIGPYDPNVDVDKFLSYASKMSSMSSSELHDVVLGCIHGQTRLYAAGLTVLEMFGDRDSFKEHVQERIQKELLSFGLKVYNGNVAEMKDTEGNAYFSSLKQKAIAGATHDARVEVRRNWFQFRCYIMCSSHNSCCTLCKAGCVPGRC